MNRRKDWVLAFCLAGMTFVSCSSDTITGSLDGGEDGGVRCESNDDCTDPALPICSEDGKCVADKADTECSSDSDCKNEDKPVCSAVGTCVAEGTKLECSSDSDCKNEDKPVCSAVGTCVAKGTQLECARDADCEDPEKPVCSAVGTCVAKGTQLECVRDADCKDSEKPVCSSSGTCTASPDGAPGCKSDVDCKDPSKPICNDGTCVQPECTSDSDCDKREYCSAGRCIAEVDCTQPDADGDTIADVYEGRNLEDDTQSLDTDGDTVPDYLDLDSDGDTIPDSVEGGTDGCSGAAPVDFDGDTVPDFQDSDSDDNGIPDMYEGCPMPDFVYRGEDTPKKDEKNPDHVCSKPVDTSGDGIPDFQDIDNDGDGILDVEEIMGVFATAEDRENGTFGGDCDGDGKHDPLGNASSPIDCDGDTIPDYMDTDSDGDTIPDIVESRFRVTDDLARYSLDADGDTILDSVEAGDDPMHPRDTDGDMIPDYLDLDSDGDGLTDSFEYANKDKGYNYLLEDSDGDGAGDLIEFGAGTNPGDAKDNPQSRGNFVFVAPYEKATTPERETLSFETAIQTVDIYFSIDQSGSMGGEIRTLRNNLPNMLESLQCRDLGRDCKDNKECEGLNGDNAICGEKGRCIESPKLGSDGKGCFSDMWTGIGWWGNINRFRNASSLSEGADKTVVALGNTPSLGSSENSIQPPICALYGTTYGCTDPRCYQGDDSAYRFGCVGFRKGAIKIYVQAGDEPNVNEGEFTVSNASKWGTMFKDEKVRYVGLYGDRIDALDRGIKQFACFAESCPTPPCSNDCNNPTKSEVDNMYVERISDTNIHSVVKDTLRELAKEKEIQITTEVVDIDPGASKLIEKLELNTSGKTVHNRICTDIDMSNVVIQDYPAIKDLLPGTSVCFDVIPVQNQNVIKPESEPRVYKARVNVLGDGSVLNSGIAYFLVPGEISQEVVN